MRFTYKSLVKVIAFVVTTGLMIAAVGVTFARVRLEPADTYHAILTDASGLRPGSDVRGNGVSIGSVKDVERRGGGERGVEVTFAAATHVELTSSTQARIRYANLTGDRYLDLTPGDGGEKLDEGATIPVEQTRPALELDDFFAGFDPLMRALDADQVNQLAQNLLAVTQGQAGSVRTMLSNVASFSNGLARHDELIGEVITNLSSALELIDGKRNQFDQLIVGLADLLRGLAKDREVIGKSIEGISRTAADVTDLLTKIRPGFSANLAAVDKLSGNVLKNKELLATELSHLAGALYAGARLSSYGSMFNFYLCSVRVRVVTSPDPRDTSSGVYTPMIRSSDERCKFPEER